MRAATIQGLKDYSFSITRAPYALHDDFAVQYRYGTVIDTSDGYAFGIRGRVKGEPAAAQPHSGRTTNPAEPRRRDACASEHATCTVAV